MIILRTGSLPRRKAIGVYQVITYLRELAEGISDGGFTDLPDTITVPAVRITTGPSFEQEIYGSPDNPIQLKILDRNERDPKVVLQFGNQEDPVIGEGDSRLSFFGNPFRDVKRIEEYEASFVGDSTTKYLLIKMYLENANITFAKWV
jgi:hypothetical protein